MKNEFDDDDDGDKGDVIWAIQEKNRAKGVADLSIMCEYFIHTYVHTSLADTSFRVFFLHFTFFS